MAVLPMQRVTIYALKKNRKQLLELLQRFGAVEISDAIDDNSVFYKDDMSASIAAFQKNILAAKQSLDILENYAHEKKPAFAALNGKKQLENNYYQSFEKEREDILSAACNIISLDKQITENNANIPKLLAQLEGLTPWLPLDISLDFKGTKATTAFIGIFAGETAPDIIYSRLNELAPQIDAVDVNIISTSKEQTCVLVFCKKNNAIYLEEALRKMGFARPSMLSSVIPAKKTAELKNEIEKLRLSSEQAKKEIEAYKDKRNSIEFMVDYFTMRTEKYEAIAKLAQSRNVFILSGYIPEQKIAELERLLNSKFDVAVEFETPSEDEDVPVALHNNKFSSPVEWVLKSFSLPGKGEIDPTFLMSLFYYGLFGLMLSDAAYGLVMVIGCGFCLLKFKNMEDDMRKTLRMFFSCGISTTFWGSLFGSWFGNLATVVSTTFIGKPFTIEPLWFDPVKDPMKMLMFAMAIGVIHLYVGLGAKFYQCVKAKQYKDAIYDAVFWYMLVTSLIVMLLSTQQFVSIAKLSFILPPIAADISGVIASAASVGIILTAGRESKNWFKRILKGLYGLYNVTGYLSDILSYSRLLALGLATGVIATVINQMGSMGGNSVTGVTMFILVFIIGHSINIGINLLGAYVHTNRLQFVEFFGKFYEGGGREFEPFAEHTKYYKIREEINHG